MAEAKRTTKHIRLAIKNACELCNKKHIPFLMIYEADKKGSRLHTNVELERLKNFHNIIERHIKEVEIKEKFSKGNEKG